MVMRREALIAQLAASATPVRQPGRIGRASVGWLAISVLVVIALLAAEPWREGAFLQLVGTPRLLLETLLGLGAIVMLALAAFRSGIPSGTLVTRELLLAALLLAAWLALQVYALLDPAIEPSMEGKRAHCALESLFFGAPALLMGCVLLRRLWPLHGAWSGMLLGLAAGAMPVLAMQLACMYQPLHNLQYHLAPGLALGAVGAIAGAIFLRAR